MWKPPEDGEEAERPRRTRRDTLPLPDPYAGKNCCDWIADGRCHYPGTMQAGGKWFCRHHAVCDDPSFGAEIVRQSREKFPYPDWSPAAVKTRSLADTQKEVAEHNAIGKTTTD